MKIRNPFRSAPALLATPLLALALLGCKKDEEPEVPPGALLDLSVASGVDVQTGIVPLGSGVLARAVNHRAGEPETEW